MLIQDQFDIIQNLQTSPVPEPVSCLDFFCRFLQQDSSSQLLPRSCLAKTHCNNNVKQAIQKKILVDVIGIAQRLYYQPSKSVINLIKIQETTQFLPFFNRKFILVDIIGIQHKILILFGQNLDIPVIVWPSAD